MISAQVPNPYFGDLRIWALETSKLLKAARSAEIKFTFRSFVGLHFVFSDRRVVRSKLIILVQTNKNLEIFWIFLHLLFYLFDFSGFRVFGFSDFFFPHRISFRNN